jgi:hypothetical protein
MHMSFVWYKMIPFLAYQVTLHLLLYFLFKMRYKDMHLKNVHVICNICSLCKRHMFYVIMGYAEGGNAFTEIYSATE